MGTTATRTTCHAHRSITSSSSPPPPPTAVPTTLVPRPLDDISRRMIAKGAPPPTWMTLAPDARMRLQPLFTRFRLNLSNLTFSTGGAFGQVGITFGDTILLSTDFSYRQYKVQLGLLAHEIIHSVQYRRLGWVSFLSRYLREWRLSGGDPYMHDGEPKSDELLKRPLVEVDPTDPSYYLDQLCDRFRRAAERGG
jgi:hypothetical protein